MTKKSLWFITILMTIALVGVFFMQQYYIRQAYKLRTQLFEQKVNTALNSVAIQVQKRNAVTHIEKKTQEVTNQKESNIRGQTEKIVAFNEKFKQSEEQRKASQQQTIYDYLIIQDNNIKQRYITPLLITEEEYQTYKNQNQDIIKGLDLEVQNFFNNGVLTSRQLSPKFMRPKIKFLILNHNLPDTLRYIAVDPEDWDLRFITLSTRDKDLESKFKIEDANARQKYKLELERLYSDTVAVSKQANDFLVDVQKEMQLANVPLSRRISKPVLDTLIRKELNNQGITDKYDFWVSMARKDSVIFASYKTAPEDTGREKTHTVLLFSNDVIRDPGKLFLWFPDQNAAILKTMGLTLGSSFGFLILLIIIFTYTIYSIIRQKKISEMKTDFINNMTHEFKTPVATIMLASEALKEPEVQVDQKRVNRLAGIIYDENVRLGNHIERVLSIARIENKELNLEHSSVNVNDLITAVTDTMGLQLQDKNALVELKLEATQPVIISDELHLSNVIFNLIDNANKYSKDAPRITICTKNTAGKLIIQVADQGIGMTREQCKRIFDQFYRVPTGNLHDVKGFGLGLNYVQDILEEMNATIKVSSEKDKGTVFEIALPVHN